LNTEQDCFLTKEKVIMDIVIPPVKKYVAVAGNIGVGKSTLVKLLCNRLSWQPFYEPEADNPSLADFYRDMRAWPSSRRCSS
jgi:deoxyadenosine/deoxycytidine kinase